jgi:spore coat protein A
MPVDTTIAGANQAQNRTATHLHGGHVPWISDGGPFDWFDPTGLHGASFLNNFVPGAATGPGQAEYYYPNDQSARLMWYHDHAFGITRINAYAGIASAYVIRDAFEAALRNQGLPDYIENGGREIPLVFQDKIFVGSNILTVDPTWPGPIGVGSLWYAHVYDLTRWGPLGPMPAGPPPDPSVIPEYFGDTMLANGTVYPEVTVEARRYRLRILNACNARFLNLQMFVDDGSANGITLSNSGNPTNQPFKNSAALNSGGNATPNFLVIGTEGGFLPAPALVPSNAPFRASSISGSLIVAPAERPDVIVDFSGYAGKNIILYNDAPAPFPVGDVRNDYFPGLNNKNPVNAATPPGQGPNTRVLMRFRVVAATSADPPLTITPATNLTAGNDPLLVPLGVTTAPPGVPVRSLTLNEDFDEHGRLIQRLGTNVALYPPSFGRFYLDPTTENPTNGSTEVWQIANTTGDTHPIHFHLVNVQIISRQGFNVKQYNGVPIFNGPATPPAPDENGWKETVRMNPGEVITVVMKFNLPMVPFSVPTSPRTGGNEYVWHCHILEHEEHDMMRPLVVT